LPLEKGSLASRIDRNQFEKQAEKSLYSNYEQREAIRDKNTRSAIFGYDISPNRVKNQFTTPQKSQNKFT